MNNYRIVSEIPRPPGEGKKGGGAAANAKAKEVDEIDQLRESKYKDKATLFLNIS